MVGMSTPPVQYGTPPPPQQMSGQPVPPINQLMMNYGPPSGQQYPHNMPPNMGPPSGPPPAQGQQQMLGPPQSPQQPLLPPPPPQSPQSVSPMNPMNGDYMGGGPPPQFGSSEGKLNQQQVSQLRAQIMAYRLLARNQGIPEHITAAIQGKRMTPSPQMSGMTPPPPGPQQQMQPMGPPPPPPPQQQQQQQPLQQQWRPPLGLTYCRMFLIEIIFKFKQIIKTIVLLYEQQILRNRC